MRGVEPWFFVSNATFAFVFLFVLPGVFLVLICGLILHLQAALVVGYLLAYSGVLGLFGMWVRVHEEAENA